MNAALKTSSKSEENEQLHSQGLYPGLGKVKALGTRVGNEKQPYLS